MKRNSYDKLIVAWIIIYTLLMCLIVFGVVTHSEAGTSHVGNSDQFKEDFYWLSMNIYHESRSEPELGKMLVALVTLERRASGRWGKTIKDVVTAKSQFSWYWDDKSDEVTDKNSWADAKLVALSAMMLYRSVKTMNGLMYYHRKDCNPYWKDSYEKVVVVSNHVFYKEIR